MKSKKTLSTTLASILALVIILSGAGSDKINLASKNQSTKTHKSVSTSKADKKLPESLNKKEFLEAKVAKVVDGDTISVKISGRVYKVRMLGVDTPETVHPKKPVQYYGKEASNYTKKHLFGKTVFLQKDVRDTDKYGRLLRYIWIEKPSSKNPSKNEVRTKMYNAILVKYGYARVYTYPPDVKYIPELRQLETYARENNLGLWKNPDKKNK